MMRVGVVVAWRPPGLRVVVVAADSVAPVALSNA